MPHGPVIAALQVRLQTLWEGFDEAVLTLCRAAMQQGAHMVLFPEWVCLGLLGPGGRELFGKAVETAGELAPRHEQAFSAAAARLGVAVVAGTVPAPLGEGLAMLSRVYGPTGELLHTQAKLHPSPLEKSLGLHPGHEVGVLADFPVPGVTLGVLMGRDSRVPEVARAMSLMGANLLVEGLFTNRPYNSVERFHGVHVRAFENQTMAAKSVLIGNLGDQQFRGNAKVLNLSFCTPHRDGVVAEAKTTTDDELVIGEPDHEALRQQRKAFSLLENVNAPYVAGAFPPPCPAPTALTHKVTVAAVQMGLFAATSPAQFEHRLRRFVERAAQQGASLVVFPEDVGTCLLGLYLDPVGLARRWWRVPQELKRLLQSPPAHPVGALFAGVSPYAHEAYVDVFSRLARKFSLNILAGSILLKEEEGVVNTAHLFNSGGDLVLRQNKVHLYSLEREWGLKEGHDARPVTLQLGGQPVKVGVMVCMDTGYPEMGRRLAGEGAQVLLDVTANPDECYTLENLNGLWARVQDNAVFGVKSCLYGQVGPMKLRGRSGVYAPCPLTQDRTGILSEAPFTDAEAIVTATLDFAALGRFQQEHQQGFAVNWGALAPALAGHYGA